MIATNDSALNIVGSNCCERVEAATLAALGSTYTTSFDLR
jgi:hypothetical protein